MAYCLNCGRLIEDWDTAYYTRGMLCIPCYIAKQAESSKKQCEGCGRRIRPEEGKEIRGKFLCKDCYKEELRFLEKNTCYICKRLLEPWEERHLAPDKKIVCAKCYEKGIGRLGIKVCARCGRETAVKFISEDGKPFCPKCAAYVRPKMGGKEMLLSLLKKLMGGGEG